MHRLLFIQLNFFKSFATIVYPLQKINYKIEFTKITYDGKYKLVSKYRSKQVQIGLKEKCAEAIIALKDSLVSAPILGIPVYNISFIVETGAFNIELLND